ncbi:Localization factor PodJS [uncultured Phenylobacterium sp.]|uniref:Localization factor PodJS n=1 Tax=uncultured Phenylobacterium sp. TaxID=349273 RepID=UPI0025DBB9D5|nr:Localization factor PodJS [uncultured Phenylobacterium sp.]
MSAGAPWSVKGIDPKAREVAKDLARRSGMTLGEWLNRVILDDDLPEEVSAESQFTERPHRAAAQPFRPAPPRLTAVPTSPDLARVAFALDRLTDRIEASETRTGLAIGGVEHSVRQALARIDTTEREQAVVAGRLEATLAETVAEQNGFGERLGRVEAAVGPRSLEAIRALEGRLARAEPDAVVEAVLQRLGERIAEAEGRTTQALEALQNSLSALDQRVWSVEHGATDHAELKFESLAQVLTHRVEAVRAEVAQKLADSAGGAVETRLAEMAEHIRQAERRSTQAVEEIGRHVLSMAQAVGKKLEEADQRGADAIDQIGVEVARIAGAVELRLARGEQAQAQAFERLSAELTRASQGLAERLTASEQRAASAIEGVGDQVARVTERIEARHDRTTADVAAQIRQSEERAASLLEEAGRHNLGPPPEPEPEPADGAPFGPELFARAEAGLRSGPETIQAPEAAADVVTATWRRLELDPPEPEATDTFAPIAETDDDDIFAAPAAKDELPDGQPPTHPPQLSTREVIQQARAAARAARGEDEPPMPQVTAKVAPRAATGRLFQGFGQAFGGRPRRAQNTTLQTALMVAGGAAFLSVGAAGIALMQGQDDRQETAAQPFGPAPRAAVALTPGLAPGPGQAGSATRPTLAQVRADVEAGAPGALQSLRALAEAGDAQAQLYLGQLYDAGKAGLIRDPQEARRLTAMAAESGDAAAMHNLGVYYFRGEGGGADFTAAAQWFKKAAAAGVVESQYNLGLLYQSGSGVPRDLAEARRWFTRAAERGDAGATRALADMATPGAQRPTAQRPTAQRPASSGAAAAPPAISENVRHAQGILAKLGYYDGPADGQASEAYKVALFRYQQDQRDQAVGPKPYFASR